MNTDLRNFREWYVDTLSQMYPRRESGIAVLMLSIPLLERYLRQKNSLSPSDKLNVAFRNDLCSLFSALADESVAAQFWNVFRNGFLHQVTFSAQSIKGAILPIGILSHDYLSAVAVDANGQFLVNPVLFSQRIVQEIEKNFSVFSGVGVPLPTVSKYKQIPASSSSLSVYEGTSAALVPRKKP